MKSYNWFWGFIFLLSSVFVIAGYTGAFGEIGIMSVIATFLLAALIIHSLINRSFFGIFVPMAFLYTIYWQPLKLIHISPWILILAAMLASIGFRILFGSYNKKKIYSHGYTGRFNQTSGSIDDSNPFAKVTFGESSKYLHGDSLKSGQFIVSFGSLKVFFDQAQLSPEGAEIFIDCSLGEIKLYIPRHWQVIDNVHTSLGEVVNESRFVKADENSPRLIINGNVMLGSAEIRYI